MTQAPFALPERPPVRRIRGTDPAAARPAGCTQPMRGFDPQYSDIVDYIVGITDEIWADRDVDRIRTTYDAVCAVHSSYGTVRSVEQVVAGTRAAFVAYPEYATEHLNVAWSGNEDAGFYTSHLGFARATNLGPSDWGPATGRRSARYFVADCISKDNRIHTEWLVRDSGASVRQLGFDIQTLARELAGKGAVSPLVAGTAEFSAAMTGPGPLDDSPEGMASWARHFIDDLWNYNACNLDRYYSPDAVVHAAGEREARNFGAIAELIAHVRAALPGGVARVWHACHAEENDGVILAIRWSIEGLSAPGGVMGDCPAGRSVFMMASSHLRFQDGRIVEEWMIFDELGMLVQAYRP